MKPNEASVMKTINRFIVSLSLSFLGERAQTGYERIDSPRTKGYENQSAHSFIPRAQALAVVFLVIKDESISQRPS